MTRCSCNFVYHYSTYLIQQMPLHMCQISFSFETKTLIDPLFLINARNKVAVRTSCLLRTGTLQ